MLLFIEKPNECRRKLDRFNTSHVTLYRYAINHEPLHLEFQYISCYSLSFVGSMAASFIPSFNTSHVTLYPAALGIQAVPGYVSIHLMLLFIGVL